MIRTTFLFLVLSLFHPSASGQSGWEGQNPQEPPVPSDKFQSRKFGKTHDVLRSEQGTLRRFPERLRKFMVHQRAGELAGIPDAPDHESLRGAFAPPALNQSSRTVSAGAAGDSVAAVWTTNYASGLTSFDDYGVAIAIDASRNIYVTGSSHNDYSTIKYDSSGAEKWVARYDGPGNSYDQATTIAVDASGNVYVTGESYVAGSTYDDYATVKYNSSGTQQWVARYDGPERDDKATAIAVDASGNVYVTGESDGSGTYYDYATVKYNSSGAEQWVARYDGPGNSEDYATGIAVDSSGNVYVTGASYSSNTFFDYATVKYDTLGAEQWAARYDGPGYTDFAYAIALDASGNVYVTGGSEGSGGSDEDYATLKYNSSGTQQWVRLYNGPGNSYDDARAVTVDATGNVYVTGESRGSGTDDDYATVKYNSLGTQQWVTRYNGPGNSSDQATGIAVNVTGNVYVTGSSYGSGTSLDYATVRYSSSGDEQWVARYDGPEGDDKATAIAVDASGNVYVTGEGDGSGTYYDYATVKYNASGAEHWVARYDGPEYNDAATAIAVDASGNVYVTGSDDYATVKYNSSGTQQWVAQYDGPGDYDNATGIAVDASGNVYVTGRSHVSGPLDDYVTVKYNASGAEQWVARYDGPGNHEDEAYAIALDASGNVYVTGLSEGSGTAYDFATIKYNSSGQSSGLLGMVVWRTKSHTPSPLTPQGMCM